MPKINTKVILWLFFVVLLNSATGFASHIIGGKMTYKYLGLSGSNESYEVTLTIYQDCANGQLDAITQDNPAYLAVYESGGNKLITLDTAVRYSNSVLLPTAVINPCGSVDKNVCVAEKQFKKVFTLPANTKGYLVSYQRCCFSMYVNTVTSGDYGATYYCLIPPTIKNTSAVFKSNAQVVACLNDSLALDLAATDDDGDSLSYELTSLLSGASNADIKPIPKSGPYDSIRYMAPCNKLNPLGAASGCTLNPETGLFSSHPDRIGSYIIAMNCIEWRAGVAINKVYQQFRIIVMNCSNSEMALGMTAGKDTAVVKGSSVQFHATGGISYHWQTSHNISNDSISNPTAYFPELGTYTYVVTIVSPNGCIRTDTIRVGVVEHSDLVMPNAFSPNGDGLNDIFKPQFIGHCEVKYLRVYNRYGNMVYNGTDGWDGSYNGKQQDMQVFGWSLLYENSIGEVKSLKGNVTLIK